MAYTTKVKVVMLSEDATSGKLVTVERRDMNLSFSVNNPSEIVEKAKKAFEDKYGPDLRVRACNLQGRDAGLLYCIPSTSMRNVMAIKDIGNVVKQLPPQPR